MPDDNDPKDDPKENPDNPPNDPKEDPKGDPPTDPKDDPKEDPKEDPNKRPGLLDDPKDDPKEDPKSDPKDDPKDDPKETLPDNWRELIIGDAKNDKLAERLKRFGSPQEFLKSWVEAQDTISKGKHKADPLPENPTDEQIAKFRKDNGIPEKAEDYDIKIPEGFGDSDAEKELFKTFKEAMHEKHMTPEAVQSSIDWYVEFAQTAEQERNVHVKQTLKNTQNTLKAEWLGDYEGNVRAIDAFMEKQFGAEKAAEFQNIRLADGSYLYHNVEFLRLILQPAVDAMGPNAIFAGDSAETAKTLNERKDEIMKMRAEDPDKWGTDAIQKELSEIYQKLERINNK